MEMKTGVYDLVGGAWEYIAAYIDNGYTGLSFYGGNLDTDFYGSKNSKYKTIYNHDSQDTERYIIRYILIIIIHYL